MISNEDKSDPLEPTSKRDRYRIERFHCERTLIIKPNLLNWRLAVKLKHNCHIPYLEIRVSIKVLDIINTSSLNKSLAEIIRDLLASEIPGIDTITQHRIYYRLQLAKSRA